MNGNEAQAALRHLRITHRELADEFAVSERSVRRWVSEGVCGAPATALGYAVRLHDIGIAWRKGQVAIGMDHDGGIVFLTDALAVQRRSGLDVIS